MKKIVLRKINYVTQLFLGKVKLNPFKSIYMF